MQLTLFVVTKFAMVSKTLDQDITFYILRKGSSSSERDLEVEEEMVELTRVQKAASAAEVSIYL